MKYTKTHFVKEYEPDHEAIVELKNGRFVDVVNGRFFDPAVRVVIKGTTIAVMPGIGGEPVDVTPDYTIDLQGKTAIPGLFNTHCHIPLPGHNMEFPSFNDIRLNMKHGGKQIEKNMSECLRRDLDTPYFLLAMSPQAAWLTSSSPSPPTAQ